jgi:hypothetical protein
MITPKTKGADAIIDAWLIEGVHPPTHQKLKKQLRREWPMLAKAIERLVNAEDSPENASANENREWALKAEKERDEARKEMIRWMSIAEGRGRTDDEEENDTQAELAAWEMLTEATRERDEARAEMAAIKAMLLDPVEVELDMIRGNIAIPARPEFGGVYDTGKAMANLIRERDEARGQRDRLAEALRMITTFDFSNAIMVTELEEAIDVAWGSITTDVRYEMCRDSFSIGFRMGANSFLENAESTRAENKP